MKDRLYISEQFPPLINQPSSTLQNFRKTVCYNSNSLHIAFLKSQNKSRSMQIRRSSENYVEISVTNFVRLLSAVVPRHLSLAAHSGPTLVTF